MFRQEIATPRSPAARIIEDIHHIRDRQSAELDRLHGASADLAQLKQMNDIAGRHRELFGDLEMVVPQPKPAEHPSDFNIRLLQRLQPFSPDWRDADVARLSRGGGLGGIDAAIRADAQAIASNRTIGSLRTPGQLRRIERPGEVRYFGHPLSWMARFMPPLVLQVESFKGR